MSPPGYARLPSGEFVKDADGSGPYVFDGTTMTLKATGTGGGGGGGGGAITAAAGAIEDGADVTQGAIADAVVAAGASGSISAKMRRLTTDLSALLAKLPAALGITTSALSLSIAPASDATFLVAGAIAARADKSGMITTGGTAQNAIASNAARKGFEIQNQSAGNLWYSTLAAAVQGQPSFVIAPGQLYETPLGGSGTGAVSIIGATTGQAFAAREWT